MMSAGKRLLIVDTDAGIDDAMALCMAFHAHKRGDVKVDSQLIALITTKANKSFCNPCRLQP